MTTTWHAEGRQEGRQEGRHEGRQEGRLEMARSFLLRMGTTRFGEPSASMRAALEAIEDVDQLEALGDRLFNVSTWDALLGKD